MPLRKTIQQANSWQRLFARPLTDFLPGLPCKELPYRAIALITSRLTSKAQTTIPQPVRTALRLQPGDTIAYAIADGLVTLRRASHDNADDPLASFSEWDSAADRKAYAGL
jgi:antitoxin PrlF